MQPINSFASTPPVVKNLLIINVLVAIGSFTFYQFTGDRLMYYTGLYIPSSENFQPYQLVTHLFTHSPSDPFHLIFNMLMLWMLGSPLEVALGAKRFLILYFVAGLGAAALHIGINWYQYEHMRQAAEAYMSSPSQSSFEAFVMHYMPKALWPRVLEGLPWDESPVEVADVSKDYVKEMLGSIRNVPTVGASGAIFGVLAAFGLVFPRTYLRLLFPPIALPAPVFALLLIVAEFFFGISGAQSNIAHFAHLGGALFGMAMVWWWQGRR